MCRLAGEVADGVLFNWLTPGHARQSAEWVRAGAAAAHRPAPRLFGYVRFALGPGAVARVEAEGARYTAIPAYADHFERMGAAPVETAIAAETPGAIRPALARWDGVIDEVVLRAVTAKDDPEEHLALVRAAKPA
jgi:alkanesulfonate monooxygenase SsuD/methylene tetrahydromethanopterin reductase-like flavin-dependent oxidoreductase (luciferase family)